MSAVIVGQNIQKPAATSVFIAYSSQILTLCAKASSATATIMIAREASSTITSLRRSSRSIITPVNGSRRIAGRVWTTANVPSAISECVACRMYQATAAEFIPLPSIEITLAAKMKRRPFFCRIERMIYFKGERAFARTGNIDCANLLLQGVEFRQEWSSEKNKSRSETRREIKKVL